jgi:putative nucleotidyltransferase with HDIG domain
MDCAARWQPAEVDQRSADLTDLYVSTFQALALALDAKYRLTNGHVLRVQHNAVRLAREIGIVDPALLKAIDGAALLHDLGKLGIPDHLLSKPGPLSRFEFDQVKRHVTIGADILSALPSSSPLVAIVRHHHENWDGTGYPDSLRGTAIPVGARVLAVIDCYDALTSERPYRRALTRERAIAIIRARSGTIADPFVVAAFLRIESELTSGADESAGSASGESRSGAERGIDRVDARRPRTVFDDEHAIAVAGRLLAETPADLAVWYRHTPMIGQLVAVGAIGLGADVVRARLLPTGTGISGWVAVTRRSVRNSDPALDFHAQGLDAGPLAAGSTLAVPVDTDGAVADVLTLHTRGRDRFSQADAQLVYRLVRNAAAWDAAGTAPFDGIRFTPATLEEAAAP